MVWVVRGSFGGVVVVLAVPGPAVEAIVAGAFVPASPFAGSGSIWIPSACAAGVCVRKAKLWPVPSASSFLTSWSIEVVDVRIVLGEGVSNERSLDKTAALRVFSATRAA